MEKPQKKRLNKIVVVKISFKKIPCKMNGQKASSLLGSFRDYLECQNVTFPQSLLHQYYFVSFKNKELLLLPQKLETFLLHSFL